MTQPAVPLYTPEATPANFNSADEATEALRSGKATVAYGAPVPMRDPDGQIRNVDPAEVHEAARAGYQIAPVDEVQRYDLEKANAEQAGTVRGKLAAARDIAAMATGAITNPIGALSEVASAKLSQALPGGMHVDLPGSNPITGLAAARQFGGTKGQAYAEGVESGLSFGLDKGLIRQGLSAAIGKEAGDAYEKQQRLLQQVERSSYTQGELMGSTYGALAGGELANAGRLGSALGGPQAWVARAGAGAEDLAAAATKGLSNRLAAQMVAGAAKLGARGAAEGALMSGMQQISEDMLGDHELAAQKIFASMGHGAVAGLLGGAAIGAAGPVASRVGQKASEAIRQFKGSIAQNYATKTESLANRTAFAQTNARKAYTKELEASFGSVKEGEEISGRWMRKNDLLANISESTPEGMLPKAVQAAEKDAVSLEAALSAHPEAKAALDRAAWLQTVAGKRAQTELARKFGGGAAGEAAAGEWITSHPGLLDAIRKGTPDEALPAFVEALNQDGAKIGALRGKYATNVAWKDIAKDVDGIKRELGKHVGPAYRQAESQIDNLVEDMYARSGAATKLPDQRVRIDVDAIPEQRIPISVEHAPKSAGGFLDQNGIPRGPGGRMMPGNMETEAVIKGTAPKRYSYKIDAGNRDTMTLEQLVGYRQDVDAMLGMWKRELGLKGEQVAQWRGVLEKRVMDTFDSAARAAGDPMARAELSALKKNYLAGTTVVDALRSEAEAATAKGITSADMAARWNESLKEAVSSDALKAIAKKDAAIAAARENFLAGSTVTSALRDEVAAAAARQKFSPTAKAVGIAAGLATGDVSGILTGALGAKATQLVQKYGNAVVSNTLGKIANVGAAYQAVQATNKAMERAVDGLTGLKAFKAAGKAYSANQETIGKRYDNAVYRINAYQADSEAMIRIAHEASRIEGAPKISDAYASTLTRAATYIQTIAPPAPASSFPGQPPSRPDSTTQYRVVHAMEAIENPRRVYEDMARGKVDLEAISALKAVRPAEYNELRGMVIDKLAEGMTKGQKPSADQQMKLYLAFDVTLSPTMSPDALKMQHQAAASTEAKGQKPATKSSNLKKPEPVGFDALER